MIDLLHRLYGNTGFAYVDWRMLVMWAVVAVLLYLAVYRKFEPLLLVPIAFGAMLANLPTQGIINKPATELRAPVNGTVLLAIAEDGDVVKLNPVEKVLPATVGELGREDLVALMTGEPVGEYGSNTLLYVMRPDSTAISTVDALLVDGVKLQASDTLVWAQASGRVVRTEALAGSHYTVGAPLVEVHSEHTGGALPLYSARHLAGNFPTFDLSRCRRFD